LKDNPQLALVSLPNVVADPGALPIKVGDQTIGAVGVAGGPGPRRQPGQSPRAWRIDEALSDRKSLAQAKQQIARGESVYVQRGMGAEGQHFTIKGLELPNKE